MSITYSYCVSVGLVIQHAKRMRSIILSSVASLAVPYFSTLSQTTQFSDKKKVVLQKVYFDILYNFVLKVSHFKKN